MKKCDTLAKRPLSGHVFHPHFEGADGFEGETPSGYTPERLRRAYSFDARYTGKGVKIAVIGALDNVAAEVNMRVFSEKFSLPVPEMSVFYYGERAENTSRAWLVESSLDTQWAHVFAPDAEIMLVFAANADVRTMLSAAEYASAELSADIVCMSFGTDESASDEALSAFMEGEDCIFISSSGDTGGVVSFPSSSPHCVSVGGTNLSLGKEWILETAWINGGGGASDVFGIPAFQARFSDLYTLSEGKRATPDLSMMANYSPGVPVFVSQLGGWTTAGGTSLACACFSGICACIKERYPEIRTGVDMLSFLYGKAGTTSYAKPQYSFHDITVGKSGSYYATEGWDFATGLGSPVISQLLL